MTTLMLQMRRLGSPLSWPYKGKEAVKGHGWSDSRAWAHLEATPSSPRTVAPSSLTLCPFLKQPASVPLLMLFCQTPGVPTPTGQLLQLLQAQLKHFLWKTFLIPTEKEFLPPLGFPHTLHAPVGLYEGT